MITQYEPCFEAKMDAYFGVAAQKLRYKTERFADGSIKSRQPVVTACQYPTFEGFAASIGADPGRLADWEREFTQFAAACERARQNQKRIIISNALAGFYNSSFAQFMLINRFAGEYRAKPEAEAPGGLDVNVIYGRGGCNAQRSDGEI